MNRKKSETRPRLILGTMTFGGQTEERDAGEIVRFFLESGGNDLDTAYIYIDGKTEEILGHIIKSMKRDTFRIATKAHPRVDGSLSPESVNKQLETSLSRLGIESVDLLYLHSPDPKTPIEITLEEMNRLHKRGLFGELGLSNYASWEVAHIWHTCRSRNWIVPTVYQGMYNALTRDVERELFPCLRRLGIRFYAYNPLAGGLLTGKYHGLREAPNEGRFQRPLYRERYWKDAYFSALDTLMAACSQHSISPTSASLRWLSNHSLLDGDSGDGIILGVSRMSHLEENLERCSEADLPEDVVEHFETAWDTVRPFCPEYFRP